MNFKEFRKLRIQQKAKELAFAELDKYDQKMYLSEAEKIINKADKETYDEEYEVLMGKE